MRRFVILGIQRTGTTLIRTAINGHPQVLCLGEMFNLSTRNFRSKGGQELWGENDMFYSRYLSRKFSRRVADKIIRGKVVDSYLDYLYAQDCYAAVGFKFMFSHQKKYPSVGRYIKNNNIQVIHVVRKNVLRTLLSHLTNEVRKVAHSRQPVEQVQVEVPVSGLISMLDKRQNDSNEWEKLFKGIVPYLAVGYEAFVDNREAESRRIMTFLGLDEEFLLESSLVRLNTASLKEIIKNYVEVQECLEGTVYEAYLYE